MAQVLLVAGAQVPPEPELLPGCELAGRGDPSKRSGLRLEAGQGLPRRHQRERGGERG